MTRWSIFVSAFLFSPFAYAQEPEPSIEPTVELAPIGEETSKPKPKPKLGSNTIRIVYPSPGCLDGLGNFNLDLVRPLFDYFKTNRGGVTFIASGLGALSDGPNFVFPADATHGTVAREAVDGSTKWEIAAKDIPVLVSPYEVVFQYPYQGHFDWLSIIERDTKPGARFADTKRVTAQLLQTTVGNHLVYKLDLPNIAKDPVYLTNVVISSKIDAPDDSVQLFMLGRALGRGARIKPALDEALAKKDAKINMLVHPGGFIDVTQPEKSQLCAELIGHLNPMATIPRSQELRVGPAELTKFAQAHKLRFVAANLVDPKTNENVFRRFSVFEVSGMTIAVYGIVGQDQLAKLSATAKTTRPNHCRHRELRRSRRIHARRNA